MLDLNGGLLFLLISVLSMVIAVGYEIYRGPNWGLLIGGVLAYIGVLPLIIFNVYNFTPRVENAMVGIGIISALIGLMVIVKSR